MMWNELALHIAGIHDCCRDIWFAEQSSHVISNHLILISQLVPTNAGICIENKLTPSYMEDDFQLNEIDVMKRYIKPNDHRRRNISLTVSYRLSICSGRSCDWIHDTYF